MLKLPSFNLASQKKFTPEEIQGFKDTADVDEAKKRARQTLADYQNAIAQAQSIFSQSAQMQTPERQQVGRKEGLLLTLGDALRNVVSTAPRKYRQPQTPGIQVSQGLKDQEYARQLQDAQIGYQNQQNQILAGQRAAEVGLEKFKLGYEGAKEDVAAEVGEARFNRQQGFNEAQAIEQAKRFAAQHELDLDRFGLDEKQFAEVLRHNGVMESPEFTRTIEGLRAAGYSQEEANGMVFAPMLSAYNDYKRQLEVNKKITPSMEAQHVLDGWARESEVHTLETARIKAATAAHGRANRPKLVQDPSVSFKNKEDAAGIATNRKGIAGVLTTINGILADPKNYDATTNRLTAGAIAAIDKLRAQSAGLQKQNNTLRGNIASRGVAPQDVDSIIGEAEGAFAEGGD